MRYQVTAADLTPLRLGERDTVRSVLQNVSLILRSVQGTCPMYRGFGVRRDLTDRPAPAVRPLLMAAVKEAVEDREPRAEVLSVSVAEDPTEPGRMIPTVEVMIHV